ncbi:MAG TPA: ABC transporter permease [Chloroflexi bacterium]|nr:ABC transporter permease [Chloroflexota bacterium]
MEGLLVRGAIKAAVVIDPTFGDDVLTMRGLPLQILIDGTEPQSGAFAIDHIWGRAEVFVVEMLDEQIRSIGAGASLASLQPIDLRVRTLYNPGLKSRNDLIPGLISMVLGFPALSVALTLAHEREHGTLEQMMTTPVKRLELLLDKMIPYVVVGLFNVIAIPILSMIAFRVPFNGSFPLFFFLSAIFLFAMLGMGMVIGVFIRTQPAALALSFLLIFFPGSFLTGIFFPLASMPDEMQMEAMLLPGTHYAKITRGVFLPGVGLDVLWPSGAALLALGLVFMTIGAVFFKKKL